MISHPCFAQIFADRVLDTIQGFNMVAPGHKVLIAVSGGPDSMALTRMLMELKNNLEIHLGLAHLNHNLRGDEALADEAFVREFAREHNLDLVVETRNIAKLAKTQRCCVEEAGRNARYDFFTRVAREKGFHRIALGHHRDDNVEQVLMNLVRGAGPGGLRGIAPVRQQIFIRPLIRMPRTDIIEFLNTLDQEYRIDASNQDTSFLRNRVRHCLIPFLEKQFNPDIKSGLDRLSGIIGREDDFLDQMARSALEQITLGREKNQLNLSVPELAKLDQAISARVIRAALLTIKQDLRRITHTHIRAILDLAGPIAGPAKSLDLPGQIRVYRQKETLGIKKEQVPLRVLGRQQKTRDRKNEHPDV